MPAPQRREQLLDVTLRIIVERGWSGLSIEAVARDAGITRPVVYGLFDDLPGLLNALFERETQRVLSQLADVVPVDPGARDPDELLVESLHKFLEAVQAAPDTWRLVLLPVEGTPDVLKERVAGYRAIVRAQLEQILAWGSKRRGGPEWLDVELFAGIVQAVGEYSATLVLTEPERYPPERVVRFVAAMLAAVSRGDGAAP
jgi:AcrR family transcriptional regulator